MGGQLDILTFHRVMPAGINYFIPPMAIDLHTFTGLAERLVATGRILSLDEGVRQLSSGQIKGRKVALTFDDGYRDNFDLARSILLRIGAPATFFVPVNPIDQQAVYWWDHLHAVVLNAKDRFVSWVKNRSDFKFLNPAFEITPSDSFTWDERCRAVVKALNGASEYERGFFLNEVADEFGPYQGERLLMDWNDIRQLQQEGFSIGSHSVSHVPLTDLDEPTARHEIMSSADLIEDRLGQRPNGFCFPRGSFNMSHAKMVSDCGYSYAVTTQFGSNNAHSGVYTLRRRNMSDFHGLRGRFPVFMHLVELSGRLDPLLASRRVG